MIKGFNFHLILKKIKKNRNLKIQKCMCVCGGGGAGGGQIWPKSYQALWNTVQLFVFGMCLQTSFYELFKCTSVFLFKICFKNVDFRQIQDSVMVVLLW